MKIVMITPLDYLAAFNNREHNAVRYYVAAGDDVTLVGKTFNRRTGLATMLVDLLSHRAKVSHVDGAVIKLVDPMLNIYGGLARRHLGAEGGATSSTEGPLRRAVQMVKRAVVRVLKPLSILREVPVVLGMTATAWRASKGADVAMAFGPWGAVPAYILRKIGRVRCFAYIDRDYEAGLVEGKRARLTAWLERVLPARADVLVSIGPRLQALRHETTGKIPLLSPTGVNFDRFALPRTQSDALEIIYVGNVVEWAGVELALEALAKTRAPNLRLTIIGTGQDSYIEQLKAQADQLGIADRTRFVGAIAHSDLPQYLTSASIGLAMSRPNLYRTYAYPLKVLEYMAAGLVVLATEDTETGDIVRRAQAGKTLPFDSGALAASIDQLAGAPEQIAVLSMSGQKAARAMSWEASLDTERAALSAALAGGVS